MSLPKISMVRRYHYVIPNWEWLKLQAKSPKVGPQKSWSHKRSQSKKQVTQKTKLKNEVLERILNSL